MGVNYNPSVVTSGLVLALDAANLASYPGTGTAWSDISGRLYNATLFNSPSYSSANNGVLVLNSASSQYLSVPAGACPSGTSAFTFSHWFNYSSLGNFASNGIGTYGFILADGAAQGYLEYAGSAATVTGPILQLNLQYYGGGQTGTCSVAVSLSSNTWYNLVLTSTGSAQTIYVNGVSIGTGTLTSGFPQTPLNMYGGNPVGAFSGYMSGSIGSIFSYNRALSAAAVLQNFNAHRGRYGV